MSFKTHATNGFTHHMLQEVVVMIIIDEKRIEINATQNAAQIQQLRNKIGQNLQYHLLFGRGDVAFRGNQKEAFLPHEGFPHNSLAIPPCLVFW